MASLVRRRIMVYNRRESLHVDPQAGEVLADDSGQRTHVQNDISSCITSH